ncbi:MAG: response regulator [Clostridia bacterium]
MHKVMIVDDERMIINSLALGFNWKSSGFEVIATATSGQEALRLLESLHPDVVFTDIKMPGTSGLDLMIEAKKRYPRLLFVVISGHADFTYAQKAIQLGAIAYCLKPLEDEDIQCALDAAKEELSATGSLCHAALRHFLDTPTPQTAHALLTLALPGYRTDAPAAIGLSLGDASPLFTGSLQYTELVLSKSARLYLFCGDLQHLASPAFHAALLGAVTSRQLTAFVYDVTPEPEHALANRFTALLDQLYTVFFDENNLTLGRAQEPPLGDAAYVDALALLANKTRPYEVLLQLSALTPGQARRFTISDALLIHNLCENLLSRIRNLPYPQALSYGFELAEQYASFESLRQSLCRQLKQECGGNVDTDQLRNETLAQIVTELGGSFTQEIVFQELCAHHHINPSYLSQLFRKELGMTFTSYVNQLRIHYAKELLESTTLLVAEVSDRVGYDNYLHFTKLFKRETGMTPKQYRLGLKEPER